MSPRSNLTDCESAELACAYAAQALASSEVAAAEAHIILCPDCQREVESLALRIAEETGKPPALPTERQWVEPEWEQVAPGIECKLLATDTERHRVSMLVRLAPGARYPAHTHAGVQELHFLDGFPTPYKSRVSPYLLSLLMSELRRGR